MQKLPVRLAGVLTALFVDLDTETCAASRRTGWCTQGFTSTGLSIDHGSEAQLLCYEYSERHGESMMSEMRLVGRRAVEVQLHLTQTHTRHCRYGIVLNPHITRAGAGSRLS